MSRLPLHLHSSPYNVFFVAFTRLDYTNELVQFNRSPVVVRALSVHCTDADADGNVSDRHVITPVGECRAKTETTTSRKHSLAYKKGYAPAVFRQPPRQFANEPLFIHQARPSGTGHTGRGPAPEWCRRGVPQRCST